jgi:hypothetical protein
MHVLMPSLLSFTSSTSQFEPSLFNPRKRPSITTDSTHQLNKMAKPVSDELGKMIVENVVSANKFPSNILDYFRHLQGRGNFTDLKNNQHPAKRLLRHISSRGAPVIIQTPPWPATRTAIAVQRGPVSPLWSSKTFFEQKWLT